MAYLRGQPFTAQFIDPSTGLLMQSGTIEFYLTGTSTPTPYYTDSSGTSGGTSLTLDSGGKPPNNIFFDDGITYKIVTKDAAGTTLETIDPYNVTGSSVTTIKRQYVADMTSESATAGDFFIVEDYASGRNAGPLFFKCVAGTGTDNGGSVINHDTLNLRFEQDFVHNRAGAKQYGNTGDGVTDDTTEMTALFGNEQLAELFGGTYLLDAAELGILITDDNRTIVGDYTADITTPTIDHVGLRAGDVANDRPENINFLSLVMSNNVNNTDDNHHPLRISGVKKSLVAFNNITAAYWAIQFGYSREAATAGQERRTSQLRSIGNVVNATGAGLEYFSNINSVGCGNVATNDGATASAHGFRFTGYGLDEVTNSQGSDLRYRGNAHAAYAAENYGNGLSQQAGAFANTYSSFSLIDVNTGFQFVPQSTSLGSQSRNNTFSCFAIDECEGGMNLEKTERHVFDSFSISNFDGRAISHIVASSGATYGTGKYNRFNGLISEQTAGATEPTCLFEGSNNRIELTLAEINGPNGCQVDGDYNIITIVGGEMTHASNALVRINGDNNILTVAADNVTADINIRITGDNNDATVNLDTTGTKGKVLISGAGNVLRGVCNLSTISAGNDVTGVKDARRRDTVSGTTDVSGDLTITHGLIGGDTSYLVTATSADAAFRALSIHSITSSTFKIRFFDAAGSALASTSVSAHWIAEQDYG